jgi:drug/metabolite transporter (DMT)-like permease
MLTAFFVSSRIIANPLSNVFQKKLGVYADAPLIILTTYLLLTLGCLPALWLFPPTNLGLPFWENMLLCVFLAVAGNTLIVAALKSADLSVLGPLNAYKSIVGLLLGAFLLGEVPTLPGMLGVLMILGGSFFIMDRPDGLRRKNPFLGFIGSRGVQLRLAALVLSATEAVFLKKAVLLSSPGAAFVYWCILGLPLAALAALYAVRGQVVQQLAQLGRDPASCLLLGATTGLMQFATLYTFAILQVGYSLALFQTSTLLSVLFGYRFFQEQHMMRRLLGAIIMIVGAILVVVFGNSRN